MARVELAATPTGVVVNNAFEPVAGASVNIYTTGTTTAVPVYADTTTSSTIAQPLTTDADGRLPGYVDPQQTVDVVVTVGGTAYPAWQTEIVRGDVTPVLDGGQLSLSQLPTHASRHASGGSDAITPAAIGAASTAAVAACLQASSNLTDVASVPTARSNLGLGSAATHATTDFLQVASGLSDLTDVDAARGNLAVPVLRSAQVAATSNLTLSGLQTVDGYTLLDGDRILLTGQTAGAQNGPWVAHSGAWARPADYGAGSSLRARLVQVNGGTVNGGTLWAFSSTATVTVDSTATAWAKVTGGSTTAGVTSFNGRSGAVAPTHGDYTYVFRTTHTYSVQGALATASGSTDSNYLPPFFISVGANETVKLVKARGVIGGGTSVACTLQKNGANVTGFTSLSVTTTPASTTPTAVAVAEDDEINLVLASLAGSPSNLSFTIVLEHTVS